MKLILASTSKYRRAELLKLAIPFEAQAPQFNEDDFKNQGHSPWELSRLLALGKAKSLLPVYQDQEVVILYSC